MPERRLRLLLALAALGAATALVAGCGATQSSAPPVDDLAQVADRTTDARTASFSMHAEETLGSRSFTLAATGAFDTTAERARVSVDLSGLAQALGGLGQMLGAGLGDPADWKLDAIREGTQVYVSSPLLRPALPSGKSWVTGDVAELARAHGLELGQLGSLGGSDPGDVLGLLRATSGGLERVGTDTMRGVQTTHYRAALDPKKVARLAATKAGPGALDTILAAIEHAGLDEIPIDVWVDGDSLLRRLDASVSRTGGGSSSASKLSVELFDYGVPVVVTRPPASEVAQLGELHPHG